MSVFRKRKCDSNCELTSRTSQVTTNISTEKKRRQMQTQPLNTAPKYMMPMPNVAIMAVALVASRHGNGTRSCGSDERSRKRTRTSRRCAYNKRLSWHRRQPFRTLSLCLQSPRERLPKPTPLRKTISRRGLIKTS